MWQVQVGVDSIYCQWEDEESVQLLNTERRMDALFLQLSLWFETGMVKYSFPEHKTRTWGFL